MSDWSLVSPPATCIMNGKGSPLVLKWYSTSEATPSRSISRSQRGGVVVAVEPEVLMLAAHVPHARRVPAVGEVVERLEILLRAVGAELLPEQRPGVCVT